MRSLAAGVLCMLVLASGCGAATSTVRMPSPSGPPTEHTGSPAPPSPSDTATPTSSTSPDPVTTTLRPTTAPTSTPASKPTPPTGGRTVSEAQNGKVVAVRRGTVLTLVLHSTYWTIDGSSEPSVLTARGSAQHSPDPPGSCLPGVGCGTVHQQFSALRDGTSHLRASRSSCGEALPCRPDQATYEVTVDIIA
jgi:hypothetical protein